MIGQTKIGRVLVGFGYLRVLNCGRRSLFRTETLASMHRYAASN
jgi:hypothetical protein